MHSAPSAMIRPVILCGGAGTRLWPVSREQLPKQFLALTGSESLLQQTAGRLSGEQFSPTIIVSGEEQRLMVQRQLRDAGVEVDAILLEPVGRNTAAAAALAAAWLKSVGRDDLMLLMPSDHVIGDPEAFMRAIETGAPHAQNGAIVTFGAQPTEPNTQYGYIEAQDAQVGGGAHRIARFHEKPDAEKASHYLATGRFFWNCGIFLAKASTILAEMRNFLPESLNTISEAMGQATRDDVFVRPAADLFAGAENISIDNAVMERTSLGVVVPVQMQWSDVGAWDAVWKLGEKDERGNVVDGRVTAIDCNNSLLRNESRAVLGSIGLQGLAVIAEPDAIFVAPMERVSEVKQLVARLRQDEPDVVARPAKVALPWGSCESIGEAAAFQVHHVIVEPGQTVPTQTAVSSLHWVIINGSAEVTIGDDVSTLRKDDSVFVAPGTQHGLTNRATTSLEIVQIDFGA